MWGRSWGYKREGLRLRKGARWEGWGKVCKGVRGAGVQVVRVKAKKMQKKNLKKQIEAKKNSFSF